MNQGKYEWKPVATYVILCILFICITCVIGIGMDFMTGGLGMSTISSQSCISVCCVLICGAIIAAIAAASPIAAWVIAAISLLGMLLPLCLISLSASGILTAITAFIPSGIASMVPTSMLPPK